MLARNLCENQSNICGSIFREPEAKETPFHNCKKHRVSDDATIRARSSIRRSRASLHRQPTLTQGLDTAADNSSTTYRVSISGTPSERQQAFARLVEEFRANHALRSEDNNSSSSGDDTVVPLTQRISDRPQSRRGPNRRSAESVTRRADRSSVTEDSRPRPSLRRVGHRSVNAASYTLPAERAPPTRPVIAEASNHFRSILDPVNASSAANGLGDRERSVSPADSDDANQWNTLLNTITPDPSLPSASSSFASSAAVATNGSTGDDNARASLRLPLLEGLTTEQWSSQRRQMRTQELRHPYTLPAEETALIATDRSVDCPHHLDDAPEELFADVGRDLRQLHVLYECGRLPVEHFHDADVETLARFQADFDAFGDSATPANEAHPGYAWEQLRRAWWPLNGPQVRELCALKAEAERKLGPENEISGEIDRVLRSPYLWLATGRSVEYQIVSLRRRLQQVGS